MHKCVNCNVIHDDAPVIEGCSCGSRVFLFVKGTLSEENGAYEIDVPSLLRGRRSTHKDAYEIDLQAEFARRFKKSR